MPKAPPAFVQNLAAWEYTLSKLELKNKLTVTGDPQNYAAACAIYKNVVKKYPAFAIPQPEIEQRRQNFTLDQLIVEFEPGTMFWFDDVLCEASDDNLSGNTIVVGSEGNLLVAARVLDVDPEGAHRGWDEGDIVLVDPARCADFVEGVA